MWTRASLCLLALALCAPLARSEAPAEPVAVPNFDRQTAKDAFDRTVTFYLSNEPAMSKLPIALFVQGSGGQSMWTVRDGKVSGSYQNVLRNAAKGRARAMIVEKPGVVFGWQGERPGTAQECPEEFLKEHTLPRWAEAISASLKAARVLPGVDPARTCLIGHSEGGIVVAKVAADNAFVTHVAVLAGGGPTQLFDMAARYPFDEKGENEAYATWRKIRKDPESVTEFAWGHPYRRWSSFCSTSVMEQLEKTKSRVYLAQGMDDKNVAPVTFDVLHAELVARNRDVTAQRITGVDHGFRKPEDKGEPKGFLALFDTIVTWAGS